MGFKFLRDQPLQTDDELKNAKFGHVEIAKTLADMVQHCDTPFTIGLFGKWGSGKSTIANLARAELRERGVPVVIFDVWKHEGDSLRRCFLKELVNQLKQQGGFSRKFELDERVEASVSQSMDKLKLDWAKVKQLSWLFALALAIGFFSLWLGQSAVPASWRWLTSLLVWISWLCILFLWWFVKPTHLLATERTVYTRDRLQDPHEFESQFAQAVKASADKILIVFDNIDRVSHHKAVRMFSMIKTFLEPKDVEIEDHEIVFLIPCDDQAIRAHLQAAYDSDNGNQVTFDPDEFLKKFFNAVIWIPSFIPSELEAYTRARLVETNEPELNDPGIAWLITKAYRDNPRQIIQFVNTLLSNFLLMRSREGEGKDFEDGFTAQKKKEICLYLLLAQIYPQEMSWLREAKVLSLAEIPQDVAVEDQDRMERFKSFVAEVALQANIDNLKPYYTLRRSEQEKKFPGIEDLFVMMDDNRVEEATEQARKIPNIVEWSEDFSLAMTNELELKTNLTTAAYFINSLLHVLSNLGIILEEPVSGSVLNAIKRTVGEAIDIISPKRLCDNILKPYPRFTGHMARLWMSRLSMIVSDDELRMKRSSFIHELMEMFAHSPHVAQPVLEKLRGVLAEYFPTDLDVLTLFTETEENQNTFLSWALVKAFIDSIAHMDIASVPGPGPGQWKLDLLPTFSPSLFDTELLAVAVAKLAQLVEDKSAEGWSADRAAGWQRFLESMQAFLCKHDLKPVALTDQFIGFGDSIIRLFDTIPDCPDRRLTVPVLMVLERFLPAPKLREIESRKVEFYRHAPLDAVKYCLPFAHDEPHYVANSPYTALFKDRSMKDPVFFNFFYEKLPDKTKGQWFVWLLKANHRQALSKLKEWKYDVPYKDLAMKAILDSANGADVAEKLIHYEACNNMECNKKPEFTDAYVTQLKSLLRSTEAYSQQVAVQALRGADFLEEGTEREIAKEVHDWLELLDPEQKYQHNALDTIEMYADRFNPQERDDVMQYCFDHLIRKGPDAAAIDLGFRIITKYVPAYEDRKGNFDDALRRVEHERDVGIKTALIKGLRSLKPGKTNKQNSTYWKRVDSLGKDSPPDA